MSPREIAAAIRRHWPDVVITVTHRDFFALGMFNIADHRIVGLAVLDTVRDAANRWIFTDLTDLTDLTDFTGPDGDALEPWSGVRFTGASGFAQPTHAVDITDHLNAGIPSLRAHRAYPASISRAVPKPATCSAARRWRMRVSSAADRLAPSSSSACPRT